MNTNQTTIATKNQLTIVGETQRLFAAARLDDDSVSLHSVGNGADSFVVAALKRIHGHLDAIVIDFGRLVEANRSARSKSKCSRVVEWQQEAREWDALVTTEGEVVATAKANVGLGEVNLNESK